MENILLVLIVGSMNLLSFYLGIKVNKKDENKTLSATKIYKKHKEKKEEQKNQEEYKKQQEEINVMLENIEVYDGTSIGQKELPN